MSPERAPDQSSNNLAGVLDALIGLWGVNETEVGEAAGISRGTVGGRRQGRGPEPRIAELRGYAEFFGVPIDLFEMEPKAAVARAVTEFDFLERKPARKKRLRLVESPDGEADSSISTIPGYLNRNGRKRHSELVAAARQAETTAAAS